MKKIFLLLLILFSPALGWGGSAKDFSALGKVPILHEGRIKPLDTFAKVHLLAAYGRRALPTMSSIEWLAELLFDPSAAYSRPIFKIRNPDLIANLGLDRRENHLYSFREVSGGIQKAGGTIHALHMKKKEERTPAQNQLVDLYFMVVRIYDISRSFSLFLPDFEIHSPRLAKELNLEIGKKYSFIELLAQRSILEAKLSRLKGRDFDKLTEEEREVARLAHAFTRVEDDGEAQVFRVIPPQWESAGEEWFSPWQLVQAGQGSPQSAQYLKLWRELTIHYTELDPAAWNETQENLLAKAQSLFPKNHSWSLLRLETFYNKIDLFGKSLVFYILGFLLLAASWVARPSLLRRLAFFSALAGGCLHLVGVVLRIIIMMRPPVSTLYESIIFVAMIAVLFGLILESVRKNGLGVLIATVVGSILHFIALGYADDGDTMGMLVAVLNTNFWLATHVVTITIGYGCCLVGGVVGHAYLIRRLLHPHDPEKLREIYRNMVGISLFALFFSLFGTILGGIWADQSWGRFWGWDPKENGALLIVLWLLFLLHGILTKYVRPLGFALGMVITNIIVALAWFGVNLLNVGLHSYGFTENILFNLMLFIGFELCFGLGMYFWIRRREAK